jgi:hypothetical protein
VPEGTGSVRCAAHPRRSVPAAGTSFITFSPDPALRNFLRIPSRAFAGRLPLLFGHVGSATRIREKWDTCGVAGGGKPGAKPSRRQTAPS